MRGLQVWTRLVGSVILLSLGVMQLVRHDDDGAAVPIVIGILLLLSAYPLRESFREGWFGGRADMLASGLEAGRQRRSMPEWFAEVAEKDELDKREDDDTAA